VTSIYKKSYGNIRIGTEPNAKVYYYALISIGRIEYSRPTIKSHCGAIPASY